MENATISPVESRTGNTDGDIHTLDKTEVAVMIKNVIFDMGSVLTHFEPEVFVKRLGYTGEDALLLQQEVYGSFEWAMMDWGYRTEEETIANLCVVLPQRFHEAIRQLVTAWDQPCIIPIDGMVELLAELKDKGYQMYLLSNAGPRHREYWPSTPVAPYFEGVVVSAYYHLVKPQPEIYQTLLQKFALKADECVFVDDVPLNVAGAAVSGISGVVFRSAKKLRRDLRSMGIEISE